MMNLVSFENPCAVKRISVRKGDSPAFTGRVIGFGIGTSGYRVMPDCAKGEVVIYVNVTPRRNRQAFILGVDVNGQLVAKISK